MSVEALWIAKFGDTTAPQVIPGFANSGVVVFESDRIYGGDAGDYYIGKYKLEGSLITIRAKVTHFNGPRSDIFGETDLSSMCFLKGGYQETKYMVSYTKPGAKLNASRLF